MTSDDEQYVEMVIRQSVYRGQLRSLVPVWVSLAILVLFSFWSLVATLALPYVYLDGWPATGLFLVMLGAFVAYTVRNQRQQAARRRASAAKSEEERIAESEAAVAAPRMLRPRVLLWQFFLLAVASCSAARWTGWIGVALLWAGQSYHLWYAARGLPRQWRNLIRPTLRMRSAQGFDQTPEV